MVKLLWHGALCILVCPVQHSSPVLAAPCCWSPTSKVFPLDNLKQPTSWDVVIMASRAVGCLGALSCRAPGILLAAAQAPWMKKYIEQRRLWHLLCASGLYWLHLSHLVQLQKLCRNPRGDGSCGFPAGLVSPES